MRLFTLPNGRTHRVDRQVLLRPPFDGPSASSTTTPRLRTRRAGGRGVRTAGGFRTRRSGGLAARGSQA